jgi:predicted dehydrogenase
VTEEARVEPVRLASIGLGWWGGVLADAATKMPEAELVGCFARSEDTREAFAAARNITAFANLEEALAADNVDGLLVATPHSTHRPIIEAAAAAGKHVFVEKPLALTVEDAQAAVDAAQAAGIVLQVGHHRRKEAPLRRMRAMVDAGELGQIHHLEGNFSVPKNLQSPKGWRNDPDECPAGSMTGCGVHIVDNFQYLAGRVARVHAFSKRLLGQARVDDVTTINLEFESGPLGLLGTCFVVPKIVHTGIYGTEQSAWSEDDGTRLFTQRIDEPTRSEAAIEPIDAVTEQVAEFAAAIRGDGQPEVDGQTAVGVVAVLEAIVRSAETGQVVDVERTAGA